MTPLSDHSAIVLSIALLAALIPVGRPALAGGAGVDPSIDEEARLLIGGLGELWPAWAPAKGRDLAGAFSSGLLDRLPSGPSDGPELAVARSVAAAFHAWSVTRLPPPPEFIDAGPPAPEAWAVQALRRANRQEARLLAQALRSPSAKKAREALAKAARLRFRRVALLSAGELFTLRRAELLEGLPLYTAYHALLLGRHRQAERKVGQEKGIRYQLAPELRKALLAALDTVAASDGARYPPEISGFALALALDRTRHGWREELLRGGKSLDELLVRPARPFGNRPPVDKDHHQPPADGDQR